MLTIVLLIGCVITVTAAEFEPGFANLQSAADLLDKYEGKEKKYQKKLKQAKKSGNKDKANKFKKKRNNVRDLLDALPTDATLLNRLQSAVGRDAELHECYATLYSRMHSALVGSDLINDQGGDPEINDINAIEGYYCRPDAVGGVGCAAGLDDAPLWEKVNSGRRFNPRVSGVQPPRSAACMGEGFVNDENAVDRPYGFQLPTLQNLINKRKQKRGSFQNKFEQARRDGDDEKRKKWAERMREVERDIEWLERNEYAPGRGAGVDTLLATDVFNNYMKNKCAEVLLTSITTCFNNCQGDVACARSCSPEYSHEEPIGAGVGACKMRQQCYAFLSEGKVVVVDGSTDIQCP